MDYDLFFGWVSVIFFSLSLAVVMHAGIKNKVSCINCLIKCEFKCINTCIACVSTC